MSNQNQNQTALAHYKEPIKQLTHDMDRIEDKLQAMCPAGVRIEQVIQGVLNSLAQNDRLLQCTRHSLLNAAMRAAEWGLAPGSALSLAHIVPFGNQAVLIPDYKGLIDLAIRSGVAKKIAAHVVYENDEFEHLQGDEDRIIHRPAPLNQERGALIGVYCLVHLASGGVVRDVMRKSEIEAIRKRSPSVRRGQSSPWDTDYEEMARKTVVKRALKYVPRHPMLSQAVAADDAVAGGDKELLQALEYTVLDENDEGEAPEQVQAGASRAEKIAARLGRGNGYGEAKPEPEPEEREPLPPGEYHSPEEMVDDLGLADTFRRAVLAVGETTLEGLLEVCEDDPQKLLAVDGMGPSFLGRLREGVEAALAQRGRPDGSLGEESSDAEGADPYLEVARALPLESDVPAAAEKVAEFLRAKQIESAEDFVDFVRRNAQVMSKGLRDRELAGDVIDALTVVANQMDEDEEADPETLPPDAPIEADEVPDMEEPEAEPEPEPEPDSDDDLLDPERPVAEITPALLDKLMTRYPNEFDAAASKLGVDSLEALTDQRKHALYFGLLARVDQ